MKMAEHDGMHYDRAVLLSKPGILVVMQPPPGVPGSVQATSSNNRFLRKVRVWRKPVKAKSLKLPVGSFRQWAFSTRGICTHANQIFQIIVGAFFCSNTFKTLASVHRNPPFVRGTRVSRSSKRVLALRVARKREGAAVRLSIHHPLSKTCLCSSGS